MTICERKSGGRILCIRLSGLGDLVHVLNALSLLRQSRPDAHIAWAVEEQFAELLADHPHLNELIIVPRQSWARLLRRPLQWRSLGSELKELAARLREGRFDASLDFQSSIKSAWLVLAAGAEQRIGFGRGVSREWSHLVQNTLVVAPRTGIHRIERDLALLAPLGIATRYAAPVLPSWEAERQAVDRALAAGRSGGPLVVIHPGSSPAAAFKRWMPDRYALVADRLVAERGTDVVLSHAPRERELAESIAASMQQRRALTPQAGGLRGLAELLRRADLFIGGDTGPMHLASALGVPVVALFGPKDPVQTGPYCSRSAVVTGRAECRPCTRRRCRHVRCMTSITVEQVFRAATAVLDGGGEQAASDGPIRRAATWPFRLGRWRGQVTTCYSSPDFFTRLCEPDAMVEQAERVQSSPHVTVAWTAAPVDGVQRRLLMRQYPEMPPRLGKVGDALGAAGAQNAWRCSLRLSQKGAPVPFPVCLMTKTSGAGKEQMLLTEQIAGAVSLRDWLAENGMANWTQLSPADQEAMIGRLAQAVRRFHMAGYYHGDLRAQNLLLGRRGENGDRSVYVANMDHSRPIGWLPEAMRDVLLAADLRHLLLSLEVPFSEADRARLLDCYCQGFIKGPKGRRLLERVVGRSPARSDEDLAPPASPQGPSGQQKEG
jgi:lipopolysaccharide heptosyltransferase I